MLSGGAKFNGKKYSDDFTSFKPVEKTVTPVSVASLDFFGAEEEDMKNISTAALENPFALEKKEIVVDEESVVGDMHQASIVRNENSIRVYGDDCPFPFVSFIELGNRYKLKSFLRKNLAESGYTAPTPIQMQALPVILHGRELMACAPTGSGKTLAFLLGMIHHLKGPAKEGFRALIICPTRELCLQVPTF